jgi:VanZ family protein
VPRFLLLVVAFIIYGSLYPWNFRWLPGAHPVHILMHSWPRQFTRFELRDAAENVLLYMPLGWAAFLTLARRRSRWVAAVAAVAGGIVLSTSIELLQVYVPIRATNLADVAANAAGTLVGVAVALLVPFKLERAAARQAGRDRWSAIFLLACWIGYQLFPFFPVLSRSRVEAEFRYLLHPAVFSAAGVWIGAAAWFALALTIRELQWGEIAPYLAPLVLLVMRLFIPERAPQPADFLAVAAFLPIWALLPDRLRSRSGLFLMLSAIALAELSPFQFAPNPEPFSWIPLSASLQADGGPAVRVLFQKAFQYGSALWLLSLAGASYWIAGPILAAALFILEMLQRKLLGRHPEITDSLLTLALAFLLKRLSDSRRSRR